MKNEILFFTIIAHSFIKTVSAQLETKYSLSDGSKYRQEGYIPDVGSQVKASRNSGAAENYYKSRSHRLYQRSYNSYGQNNDVSDFSDSKNLGYDDLNKIPIETQWNQPSLYDQKLPINQHDTGDTSTVTRNIGVPVSQSLPIEIPHPVAVEVPQPYPVHYPYAKPFPVQVVKTIIVPVEKKVPYAIEKIVPVPVEKPVPVSVEKYIPVPVEKPYPIHIPVYKHIFHRYSNDEGHGQKMHNRSYRRSHKRRSYRHGRQ